MVGHQKRLLINLSKIALLQPLSCEELVFALLERAKILDEATYKTHLFSTSIMGLHVNILSPKMPSKGAFTLRPWVSSNVC